MKAGESWVTWRLTARVVTNDAAGSSFASEPQLLERFNGGGRI